MRVLSGGAWACLAVIFMLRKSLAGFVEPCPTRTRAGNGKSPDHDDKSLFFKSYTLTLP